MYRLRIKRKQKGAVLAMVLMVALLLTISSLTLISVGTHARLRTVKHVSQVSARFAADAGIERVIYAMNQALQAGTWAVDDVPTYSSQSLTASNGDYTVSYTGDLASGYIVTSVGQSNGQTTTIRATIALTTPFSEDFAIFSKNDLTVKAKAIVDGFNSSDPSDTDVEVRIGTESTADDIVDLKSGSTIDGDIVIGAGGVPDDVIKSLNGVTVNGDILYLPPDYSMPTITAPSYTASQGDISGKNITLTSSDNGRYDSITIDNNGNLKIQDDVTLYVTGDIELKNNAEVEISNNASLTLYFDGDIDAQNSSGINNKTNIPANVRLYGTGTNQKIDFKNSSDLYAIVYAPEADMTIHNKVDAYGSFIVNYFEMKNGGEIYYDEALKQVQLTDELARFTIVRWEEL